MSYFSTNRYARTSLASFNMLTQNQTRPDVDANLREMLAKLATLKLSK